MLLGSKKRTRVSDEEYDNRHENEGSFGMSVGSNGKGEETGKVDLKRMRLDLDRDTLSRGVPSEPFNSSSESSPKTPSSHLTFTDTTEYTSFSYPYHQIHQQQKQQHYLNNTPLSSPNIHKLHRNPIRISTRSDASSSSSSELLNPYMNINSVLYLANLARTSHIVNELQDDLGCMEIDERAVDVNNNGRRNETSPSLGNVDPTDSMDHELSHNLRHQYQGDGYVNEDSSEMVSGYQSINAILREAFLRRHQHIDAQN